MSGFKRIGHTITPSLAKFLPSIYKIDSDEIYKDKVLSYSPIAYWMMAEAAGSDAICQVDSPAQDGAYTGVTLGQTGIGDGYTCPLFDGVNDYNNVYSTAFRDVFNGAEGTVQIWAKVIDVGAWTDGTNRKIFRFASDASNVITIQKFNTANDLYFVYKAGGVSLIRIKTDTSETGWMPLALTWSKTANEAKAFFNGVQEGATLTGLGYWANLLAPTVTMIACNTAANQCWDGWIAHCAVWDSALSPANIADLAVV
jgi:hypothetical protein